MVTRNPKSEKNSFLLRFETDAYRSLLGRARNSARRLYHTKPEEQNNVHLSIFYTVSSLLAGGIKHGSIIQPPLQKQI